MMLQTTSKLKSISIKEKEEISSDEASTIIRRNSNYFSFLNLFTEQHWTLGLLFNKKNILCFKLDTFEKLSLFQVDFKFEQHAGSRPPSAAGSVKSPRKSVAGSRKTSIASRMSEMRNQPGFEVGDDNLVSVRLPPPLKTRQTMNPPASTKVCVTLKFSLKM